MNGNSLIQIAYTFWAGEKLNLIFDFLAELLFILFYRKLNNN